MSHDAVTLAKPPAKLDYSLTGLNAQLAVERGLAEAEWYQCSIPRETMRQLLERRDGPALRDTLLWFALLLASGYAAYASWGTWWCVFPFAIYGILYGSASDSRWHEAGHGTAFRTDWMNNALYEIASFMVMRESTVWRWSHTRHHSDTIIVGRDPEIAVPRPADLKAILMAPFALKSYPKYFQHVLLHARGRMSAEEKTYIPEKEFPRVYWKARLYLLIHAGVLGAAIATRSILPLMFVTLANLYGSWLMVVYGFTQHAGLAENVLDHRLNCRTVYLHGIHRYLYWNMNYHVEHHMFPLVPYHALPRLHEAVKHDCPDPYQGLFAAYREIVPAVLRQVKDPAHHVKRRLPEPSRLPADPLPGDGFAARADADGWIEVCAAADLGRADVLRFDHGTKTYALIRDAAGGLFATDGICTHGKTHLADGLVKGNTIECPKHNGRFHLADGSPARAPICRGLVTYPLEERTGRLYLNPLLAGGAGADKQRTHQFRVVSCRNVATFIKELILEPHPSNGTIAFTPEITFNSISRLTTPSASATSTSPPRTRKCGNTSTCSTSSRTIPPVRAAATTTRLPVIHPASAFIASTFALPARRRVRIAVPAWVPATFLASSRVISSRGSGPSAISTSNRPGKRCSTSVAARGWRLCARIYPISSKPRTRPAG